MLCESTMVNMKKCGLVNFNGQATRAYRRMCHDVDSMAMHRPVKKVKNSSVKSSYNPVYRGRAEKCDLNYNSAILFEVFVVFV